MAKTVYTPVRLEPEMYDAIEVIANESGVTISAVIREAIRQFIAAKE